jgi:hypothetical protein
MGMLAVGLALSGCTGPASQGVMSTSASTAQPLVLDDGALRLVPSSATDVSVSADQVERDLALSWGQEVAQLGPLRLGRVFWDVHGSTKVVPDGARAWVLIYRDGLDLGVRSAVSCGGGVPGPSRQPVAHPSHEHALVVDAMSGAAVIYAGAGLGECSAYAPPLAFVDSQTWSVPWVGSGPSSIRADLPPCATLAGGSNYKTLQVTADLPFGGSCSTPGHQVVMTQLTHRLNVHAPLGPLCASVKKGVDLPRPPNCVL